MRLEPHAIAELSRAARARLGARLGDQRQDDDGGDGRLDPRARGDRARPQPRRREHGRRDRLDAARRRLGRAGGSTASSACSRSTSSGLTGSRRARAARDPARQPVPRPARPLRRARDDRRPLGGGRRVRCRRLAQLVLNADDPLIADLGRGHDRRHATSASRTQSVALPEMQHASDSKHCRRCGAAYVYDDDLPRATSAATAARRAASSARRRRSPRSGSSSTGPARRAFALRTPAGTRRRSQLPLPGLYNVYNALGAAALCLRARRLARAMSRRA